MPRPSLNWRQRQPLGPSKTQNEATWSLRKTAGPGAAILFHLEHRGGGKGTRQNIKEHQMPFEYPPRLCSYKRFTKLEKGGGRNGWGRNWATQRQETGVAMLVYLKGPHHGTCGGGECADRRQNGWEVQLRLLFAQSMTSRSILLLAHEKDCLQPYSRKRCVKLQNCQTPTPPTPQKQ